MSTADLEAGRLEQSPFFRVLPQRERELLLQVTTARSYEPDALLVREGDRSDSLHLVTSGHVAVEASVDGRVSLLVVLGTGDVFGELSLVDGTARRSASVRALSAATTRELTRDAFDRLRQRQPIVDRFVQALLAARVKRLTQQLTEALHVPVEQRVARRLLDLSQVYGGRAPGTVVPLTQEQFAQLAGATRSTVNRVLRVLEEQGSVELGRGHVRLCDPTAVAALTGS